jgi:dihydrofolate reductase
MRKIKLYIAASLNGRIATRDGRVDWLENLPAPEGHDYGYQEFYQSVDTTLQGYGTYQQILDWGIEFPYKDKKNFVLVTRSGGVNNGHVEFIREDPAGFVRDLKRSEGGDIWLVGGGRTNTLLLNEGLIDELILFLMPVLLPGGIEVFEVLSDGTFPVECHLERVDTKSWETGAVELRYRFLV